MRITTGIFKNRLLRFPAHIRATQAKVRKAVFDILGGVEGLRLLELFAGSGAIGFEALSRGAAEVVFVENDPACVSILNANSAALGVLSCSVVRQDAQEALRRFSRAGGRFDLVFLDPPYRQDLAKKTLQTLSECAIVSRDGLVVAQHHRKEILPDALGDLHLLRSFSYGDTVLSVYRCDQ